MNNAPPDTCVICGTQFNAHPNGVMYVCRSGASPVCKDCRGKLNTNEAPYLYRIKMYKTCEQEEVVEEWVEASDDFARGDLHKASDVEVTIISPRV